MKKIILLLFLSINVLNGYGKLWCDLKYVNYTTHDSAMLYNVQSPYTINVPANIGDSVGLSVWDDGVSYFVPVLRPNISWTYNATTISGYPNPLYRTVTATATLIADSWMHFNIILNPTGIESLANTKTSFSYYPTLVNSSLTFKLNLNERSDVNVMIYDFFR